MPAALQIRNAKSILDEMSEVREQIMQRVRRRLDDRFVKMLDSKLEDLVLRPIRKE